MERFQIVKFEVPISMPILSLTATSVNVVDGEGTVQVYCVQTQAIQQYALDLSQCVPPLVEPIAPEKDASASRIFEISASSAFTTIEPSHGNNVGQAITGDSRTKSPGPLNVAEKASTGRSPVFVFILTMPPYLLKFPFLSSPRLSGRHLRPKSPSRNFEQAIAPVASPGNQEYLLERKIDSVLTTLPDMASLEAIGNSRKRFIPCRAFSGKPFRDARRFCRWDSSKSSRRRNVSICAFIFGSVFWDRGSKRDTVQVVFNVMGALFSAVLFVGVNNASSVQPVVSVERTVYYREKATGMYDPFPYALAQGLVELPYILVRAVIYGSITYFMINFDKTAEKFFLYLLFMFLTFTYCAFYGMMAIGLMPSQQLAAVVSSAFYSIWNLLSGFLIPKPKIPRWWIWFYYIYPFAWTLNGIISSQLGDVSSKCNQAANN